MARGDGRGFRGRGRGRGGGYRGGRGGGTMRTPGSSMLEEDLEFNLRMFADAPNTSGGNTPRGGGRGGRGGQFSGPNSGSTTPNRGRGRGRGSGYDSPRGRGGYDSPRGRGRGRGGPPDSYSGRRGEFGIGASPRGRGGGQQRRPDTLSGLLYQERPFLRPIKFVPSVLTKVLFEEEQKEELLKPGVEDVDETEQSHVPTAEQVFRVFSGGNIPRMEFDSEDDDDDEDQEEIEEVDFNDVEKLFNPTAELKTTTVRKSRLAETTVVVEQQFTGFYIDENPATSMGSEPILADQPKEETVDVDVDNLTRMVEETLSTTDEQPNADDIEMSAPQAEESLPETEEISLAPTQPETAAVEQQQNLFCIDVQPSSVPENMAPSGGQLPAVLQDEEEDDIIVYVAPHPRKTDSQNEETSKTTQTQSSEETKDSEAPPDTSHFQPYVRPATLPTIPVASSSTPVPSTNTPIPSISSLSFSFSQKQTSTTTPGKASSRLVVPPVSTPRQAKAWKRKRGVVKKGRMRSSFGAFGAMREEAMLHKGDPRRNQRRRGDSDLEWGDSDDDDEEVDEVEEGLEDLVGWKAKAKMSETTPDKGKGKAKARDDEHGMDVDPDLAPDMAAMRSFVGGLLGKNAGQHTTMDDLRVAEMIRMEDEEEDDEDNNSLNDDEEDSSEDESEEDVLAIEEAMLISESLEFDDELDGSDSDDSDDDDEDEDKTPRTSFQARLERLREKARSKKTGDTSFDQMEEDESDEDKDDFINRNMTWADEDEDFIQEIQDMLDENEEALKGNDRKTRNAIFRSIRDGDFEDLGPARKGKNKGKGLPAEMQELWDRDRKKKAEYKKARELARLENAADPMSKKKGGKKGRKAMLAAAKLDPTITVIPNRIIDMVTLVQQIRRFIAEIGGPVSMSLPPTNKETRKNIHEMAVAFNLKSISKGKNDSRYTTLTKTSKTGFRVDEAKVAKIVRRSGGMGARGDSFIYDKKGKGAPVAMPRHREGEEVGKAAPKLTESNVGFRMLAMMGWSEGDRIGFTGGLDAPLTAIIKHTKLGLGATK